MLFSEAILAFKAWRSFKVGASTVKGYELYLRQFCLFVRNKEIEEISIEDVLTWFSLMRDLKWEHNSFMPKAMALKKFFEFFKKQGKNVIDPWLIPVPHKEYKIPRVATSEVYRKLVGIVPKNTTDPRHLRNLAIINLLWDTGARNGEIVALDLEDVDIEGKKVIIKTEKSKGRRPFRELFWTDETNENLKRWITKRRELGKTMQIEDKDALFISLCNIQSGKRLNIKGVGEMLRHYSNKAKIPPMNAHAFRHHMGRDIVEQGGSSADVMNILGHATLASSSIYVMMTDKQLEERYRKFKGK